MPEPNRRERVLDAAVTVLGSQGSRRLTHRAVDAEAGLPAGTTSNHFRTRDALVSGVLARVAEREQEQARELAAALTPGDPDALADGMAEFVHHLLGPARTQTLARHALFLEAAWDNQLRYQLAAAAGHAAAPLREQLVAAGSADPDAHLRLLLDYLDGLVLHQLAMPVPDFAPERQLRLFVRALLG
ncbi:TetR/AcrR family transcriptional regulator [Amycolatopsis anabasis]|uniref:TetR/AcrR family transcriptional regulator n=1 Tax=Amycolatopsis anabasis TaxID=1840409 RepID=UPI00131CC765|nr:TetR/AcrR family transcriptional regulator [Amycolatopsis anabasis]